MRALHAETQACACVCMAHRVFLDTNVFYGAGQDVLPGNEASSHSPRRRP